MRSLVGVKSLTSPAQMSRMTAVREREASNVAAKRRASGSDIGSRIFRVDVAKARLAYLAVQLLGLQQPLQQAVGVDVFDAAAAFAGNEERASVDALLALFADSALASGGARIGRLRSGHVGGVAVRDCGRIRILIWFVRGHQELESGHGSDSPCASCS
jgi:hypothetical protein